MPAPLAKPSTLACLPPIRKLAADHLGRVSVVIMARATRAAASVERIPSCARRGIAPKIFPTSSGTPITPVEQTNTSSGLQPSSRATAAVVARDVARPLAPVAQLAFPEL